MLVVTGLPGTGKTTLARELARRHGVPLIGKDLIKEPLFDTLGASDRAGSRRLSDASFAVLFALLRELAAADVDVILEGNFRPGEHEQPLLDAASARIAQVLCRVDEPERLKRLAARKRDSMRHAGHMDGDPIVAADRSGDAFLNIPAERFVIDSGDRDPFARRETQIAIDRWWSGP